VLGDLILPSYLIRRSMLISLGACPAFAAGDVRSGSTKRVAPAVGEGAMAIHLVHERMHSGRPARRGRLVLAQPEGGA
jgi:thioredoxin reductase (NADPH)